MDVKYDILVGKKEEIKKKSIGLRANGFLDEKSTEILSIKGIDYILTERVRPVSSGSQQPYTPTSDQTEDMKSTRTEVIDYLKKGGIESMFVRTMVPEQQW